MKVLSYEIYIEHSVEKELRQIPKEDLKKISFHIRKLGINPRQGAKKLKGSQNDWRIRVGDYRVIYEIDDNSKVIRLMKVSHRKSAYR
jgi:mRNA interferase RelE/StbE